MSRDHKKLRVFQLADELVLEIYGCTRGFPSEERYGLQAQIRRGAISVPTNIVEGSARATTKDYQHFIAIALGSASEVRYLLSVAHRLGFLPDSDHAHVGGRYDELVRGLQSHFSALDSESSR
jgi:four helix bundle protein